MFEKTGADAIYYLHGPRLDEIISDSRGYCYHTDGLGSVANLTDSSGTEIASYDYKAFGEVRNQQGSISNRWLFTGREFDSESGLYFYRNRYYDSGVGRFINRDPMGFKDGPNLYLNCKNNPVNFRDPFGLTRQNDIDNAINDYRRYGSDEVRTTINNYERTGGTFRYDETYDGWGYYAQNNNTIQLGHKSWDESMNGRTPQQEIEDTIAHELYHWQHNDPYTVEEPRAHEYAEEQRTYMNESRARNENNTK